jgi:two-component system NtrC family sensor kinase
VPNRRAIREKLLFGALLLAAMVGMLSASGVLGIYSYRNLVRSLSCRAAELPLASDLGECVGRLRLAHARSVGDDESLDAFREALVEARTVLDAYRWELTVGHIAGEFGDRSRERDTALRIVARLDTIERLIAEDTGGGRQLGTAVGRELASLAILASDLPSFLQDQLHDLVHEVRARYRTLIITTWASALAAAVLLVAIGVLTYRWIFKPLRLLGHGSRRVAAGEFGYRVRLDSDDEMAELATALNAMTERFQEIRDDLDRQVQLRTREVVRNEQLASVGFLAAGVAHEINNPLASIAMCAESLENRIAGLAADSAEAQVARRYLSLIQSEAFRCKGITEKLLDFSRLGAGRREVTALMALVVDVAAMLRHVGRFKGRTIDIAEGQDVLVMVNPQELKQVVLNLLVNALDALTAEGTVRVAVSRSPVPDAARAAGEVVLTISDDGCGMDAEVLEHLFEPFFTRRKEGQGTGLGLSIAHRIVADHGGRLEATSPGPGQGSTFRVTLPLAHVGVVAASRAA